MQKGNTSKNGTIKIVKKTLKSKPIQKKLEPLNNTNSTNPIVKIVKKW